MPALLTFLIRRLLAIPVTAVLYGTMLLLPVEQPAMAYWPQGLSREMLGDEEEQRVLGRIIAEHALVAPYPIQAARWLSSLAHSEWGWSPTLRTGILDALITRSPTTAELTLYCVLLLVPLGVASGALAGWKRGPLAANGFRATAFAATSIPPFVLALMLLAVFHVCLRWFPPERVGTAAVVRSPGFQSFGCSQSTGGPTAATARTLELDPVILAPICFSWMPYARIIHAAVGRLAGAQYMEAATAMGATSRRIVLRRLIPNAIAPAIILAARDVGGAVLLAAAFTFVGIGTRSEWSTLLAMGRNWMTGPGGRLLAYWWVFLPATLALALCGIGWNLLGDVLNAALNLRTPG